MIFSMHIHYVSLQMLSPSVPWMPLSVLCKGRCITCFHVRICAPKGIHEKHFLRGCKYFEYKRTDFPLNIYHDPRALGTSASHMFDTAVYPIRCHTCVPEPETGKLSEQKIRKPRNSCFIHMYRESHISTQGKSQPSCLYTFGGVKSRRTVSSSDQIVSNPSLFSPPRFHLRLTRFTLKQRRDDDQKYIKKMTSSATCG